MTDPNPQLNPGSTPNPYASPVDAEAYDAAKLQAGLASAEEVRRAHLWWERNIKSGGGLLILGSIVAIVVFWSQSSAVSVPLIAVVVASTACLIVGAGIVRLDRWAYVPAFLTHLLLILAFPCGSVLSLIMIPFLATRKGRFVFSDDYRAIRLATPSQSRLASSSCLLIFVVVAVVMTFIVAILGYRIWLSASA